MATIKDFLTWLHRDLSTRKTIGEHAEYASYGVYRDGQGPDPSKACCEELVIRLYTAVNRYTIRAKSDVPPLWRGYLGCTASSRMARAGESWHRGSDLPDGPLCEETWRRILCAIIQYELVKVHQRPLSLSHAVMAQLDQAMLETKAPSLRPGFIDGM